MKEEWNTTPVLSRFPSIDVLSFFKKRMCFSHYQSGKYSPDLNNYQHLEPQFYTINLRPKADCYSNSSHGRKDQNLLTCKHHSLLLYDFWRSPISLTKYDKITAECIHPSLPFDRRLCQAKLSAPGQKMEELNKLKSENSPNYKLFAVSEYYCQQI